MKKIGIICICLLLLCGCNKDNNVTKKDNTVKETIKEVYKDDNPIKISLYVDNINPGYTKIDKEYHKTWVKKEDIVVFGSFYSEADSLRNDYFQDIWYEEAEKYENYKNYKTGWNLSFELKDGTKINKTILKPSDTEEFYDYLEIYLYDSANVAKDTWYSHLLDSDIKENTILTSMKLTAGSKYEEINSNITVTVFTYDEDDFDENGFYRGNSKNTVIVCNG